MKCPKCGAFIEEGRTVCFMCGENLAAANGQGFDPNMHNNASSNIIDSTLNESLNATVGTGALPGSNATNTAFNNGFEVPMMQQQPQQPNNMGFGGPGNFSSDGGFSTGGQASAPMEQRVFNQPTANNDPHAYKRAEVKILENEEEDIFDFWAKNKTIIKPILLLLVVALIGFIGWKIFEAKMAPEKKEPKFQALYYEVDESFDQTGTGSDVVQLSKSGSKGTDCHIQIQVGSGSSGDHATEFQNMFVAEKMPEKDEQGNAVEPLDEFTTQTNSFTIHGTEWHYMNIFYRESLKQDFTQLKYQLLTAVHGGYYYDITLTNNSSSNECATALDNFTKSLEFIKDEK